ncbi:MAG TPA: MFS transporter [Bacteroidales bacterium]|nr:MFS transporter [Bacteroidales bacterium]
MNRRLIFWSACLGMMLFGITMITFGSVIPDLKHKLDIDDILAGSLFSLLPLGILAGSFLFGPIADRNGYRLLLSVSCLILAAGFEGAAFSNSIASLFFSVFFIGLGGGAVNGATNSLVSDISETGKGANLNLLGVFYGIGALGMPLIFGLLRKHFTYDRVLSATGLLCLAVAMMYLAIGFPPAKQEKGHFLNGIRKLVTNRFLILVSVFLFFESSAEGIINNWTTLYLLDNNHIENEKALFALSAFVAGMSVMRLITGGLLRNVSEEKIYTGCFAIILAGLAIFRFLHGEVAAVSGLFLTGAGLSYGFPVMLGFIGSLFVNLSGTAMSVALAFSLIGNMSLNYLMGLIAKNLGIRYFITLVFLEVLVLIFLAAIIFRTRDKQNPTNT